MNHRHLQIGLAILLLGCVGCANTAEGMKEDAKVNTEKMQDTAENVGADVKETGSDVSAALTLTPAIKNALKEDEALKADVGNIDVDSTEEKVVLNGTVSTQALKDRAQEIAVKVMKEREAKQTLENKLKVQS
jgi:osmotically-inducible protein OsmY